MISKLLLKSYWQEFIINDPCEDGMDLSLAALVGAMVCILTPIALACDIILAPLTFFIWSIRKHAKRQETR